MKLRNASLTPPQDYGWRLSVDDYKNKNEKDGRKKFTLENIAEYKNKMLGLGGQGGDLQQVPRLG